MADVAIKVTNVNKTFKLPHEKQGSVKGLFLNIFRLNRTYERQKALHDVSLEIRPGEFFGIIGRNGGGKSTLLKILAGVYSPTTGNIQVNGKLTPFIELGVGFNPELTGRDNVYLNGALLGFSRAEMDEMYDDIVEFAELEKFMDQKLKNYSSGMQVRLAFSIAIRAKSDILLIDEVLAVGDVNFQKKCIEVFEDLKREKRTIIFVSHSMSYVRDFCDRVAVLSKGEVVFTGNTEEGIDIYNKLNAEDENARAEAENLGREGNIKRFGNGQARISNYRLLNHESKETITLESGKEFAVKIEITAKTKIDNCAVGVMFRKNPQENLYGINSYYERAPMRALGKGDKVKVSFKDNLPLNPGSYYVSLAVANMKKGGYEDLDNLNNALRVNVVGPAEYWGLIASKPKITIGEPND